jgi:hypothetical protein
LFSSARWKSNFLQHLVSGAAQGSPQSLTQLLAFVQKHPLSEDELERLLPKLLAHLDRRKIPHGGKTQAFDIPLLSLRCLVSLVLKNLYREHPMPKFHRSLTAFWPHLWKWLEAICSRYIHNDTVDFDNRTTAKAAVLKILLVFTQQSSLRTLPNSSPGVIPLVLKLWAFEASKAESDASAKSFRSAEISASMVLDHCLTSFCNKARPGWTETILAPLGGNTKDIASTGLAHLRYHSRQDQPDIIQIRLDVKIIGLLSNYEPLHRTFLSQHSVPAVTRVLVGLSLRDYSEATSSEVGISMDCCFVFLCGTFQDADGCTWIVQALDEQLVCAMLRCSTWHKHLDKYFTLLLSQILPRNLIHRSVVLAMRRALKQVHAKGLDGHFLNVGHGQLGENWVQLKKLAEDRIALLKSEDNEPWMVGSSPACQNIKVSSFFDVVTNLQYQLTSSAVPERRGADVVQEVWRLVCLLVQHFISHILTFFGFASLLAYYCSLECQKADWKSTHKAYCQDLQARRCGMMLLTFDCDWH